MKTTSKTLSKVRINRIRAQGYSTQTDNQIIELSYGNRFAYRLCLVFLTIGVISASVPILSFMLIAAFLGFALPNHPFDYIYNHFLAKKMNKPTIPKRAKQLKFACAIATLWIGITTILFYTGSTTGGYIMGGIIVAMATSVSTIDLCIPSVVYNAFFNRKKRLPIFTFS